jgi:hypothetical protein
MVEDMIKIKIIKKSLTWLVVDRFFFSMTDVWESGRATLGMSLASPWAIVSKGTLFSRSKETRNS